MSKYIKQDKAIKIVESHYRVDNDLLEVIAYQISNLPPEDVQLDTKELVAKIKKGISATNADDVYSCGMRDGMRWCMSLVDDEEPLFENCPSAQPELIRCKYCKHSEHWYRDKSRCFLWHEEGIDVFEDGYCNYAERRTDVDMRGKQDAETEV